MNSIKHINDNFFNVSGPEKIKNAQSNGFKETLNSIISQVDNQIKESDQKTEEFVLGRNFDLHEVMIAAEKADLSFRFLSQVRNKLIDAYNELTRLSF